MSAAETDGGDLGSVPRAATLPPALREHLRAWLGALPDPGAPTRVVGHEARAVPGWDGTVDGFLGIGAPWGTVLSVPPGCEDDIQPLAGALDGVLRGRPEAAGSQRGHEELARRLARALGREGGVLGRGLFRWSSAPAPLADAGDWVRRDDPRVPDWLRPFNGEVLIAWDEDGRYVAGVGRKQHDRFGHELAVVTEERARGRGLGRRLVAQAARRVLEDGAVPTYLHAEANVASAKLAEAAGFPDRGWRVLGLWGASPR